MIRQRKKNRKRKKKKRKQKKKNNKNKRSGLTPTYGLSKWMAANLFGIGDGSNQTSVPEPLGPRLPRLQGLWA